LPARYRAAVPDADDAKVTIPEYDGGLGSAQVHDESSNLSKAVLATFWTPAPM
jgi:hypothetical protein